MKRLLEYMTIYDKILIVSVTVISIFFIIFPLTGFLSGGNDGGNQVIVIMREGKLIHKIPVEDTYGDKPLLIKVKGPIGTHIIEAHNGNVRVKEAPERDPEKICEKTGWIKGPGPVIVCVPNKISIWIESKETEIDGVSW
ncbi:NusG domain II-containing protein [Halothermothrix orenii]|uniref:Uncharacterized protein conserved in bacteria n=1 Tax=Halothermothrix orenii (strain H 168 / OCM 544 / DSM 9562) TaxID=373903 RepID=B8CY09_HALOH|nr:NusG domain II-containing protein [Halothermothrix orenii]ACL70178.1 uncharacterized protein conserved in bacteria [Halothermothrix orenii H 168]